MSRFAIILCLLLTGCYENVSQRTEREKTESRIRRLEIEEAKRFGCEKTYINKRGEDTGECY